MRQIIEGVIVTTEIVNNKAVISLEVPTAMSGKEVVKWRNRNLAALQDLKYVTMLAITEPEHEGIMIELGKESEGEDDLLHDEFLPLGLYHLKKFLVKYANLVSMPNVYVRLERFERGNLCDIIQII